MDYLLEEVKEEDLEKIKNYKLKSILDYAKEIDQEEKDKIINYVDSNLKSQLHEYKKIVMNNQIIGCLLLTKQEETVLDEIYIEKEYQHKGIGSSIIKNILRENKVVYLYVYKENINALNLYKKLGFRIESETTNRYYMKYDKLLQARNFCKDVRDLANKYDLPFFVVTDGASSTNNFGVEAVRVARENHVNWEKKNNFNPEEDWNK